MGRAQTIPLNGLVAIQNSQYETGKRQYVKGASVRALSARATSTDRDGRFALEFVGVKFGTPIRLSVTHSSFTVVNAREMEQVIVGRKEPLVVVMADPDRLAEAQMKFYNIATTSIGRSFKARMDSLRSEQRSLKERLAALEAEFGAKVADMNEAIELLTKQRDQALSRAQDLANEFATVDLDGASELYIQAYKLFERGEIDSVLIVLNEDRLQEEYRKAAKEKAKGKRMVAEADTVISVTAGSYRLRAEALLASGDHTGAGDQYLQLVRVHLRRPGAWTAERSEALDNAIWLMRDSTGSHDLLSALDSSAFTAPTTGIDPWALRLHRDRGLVHEWRGEARRARDVFVDLLRVAGDRRDTLMMATAHADLARVLLGLRDRVIGRAHADSSLTLQPTAEAHRIKYKEYLRRNKRARAMEHLAASLRLGAADPRALPWRRQEDLQAMRGLATRFGRQDLLHEFGLE